MYLSFWGIIQQILNVAFVTQTKLWSNELFCIWNLLTVRRMLIITSLIFEGFYRGEGERSLFTVTGEADRISQEDTNIFWKSLCLAVGYHLHSNTAFPSPCLIISLNLCHFFANAAIYWERTEWKPDVRGWFNTDNRERGEWKLFEHIKWTVNEITKVKLFF